MARKKRNLIYDLGWIERVGQKCIVLVLLSLFVEQTSLI